MTYLGSRLKYLRKLDNVTQQQLATALGIAKSTISMYENGQREPDFETLEAISDYFNVDIRSFFQGNEKKHSAPGKDYLMISNAVNQSVEYYKQSKIQKLVDSPNKRFSTEIQNFLFSRFEIKLTQSENDKKNSVITLVDVYAPLSAQEIKIPEDLFICDSQSTTRIEDRILKIFEYIPIHHRKLHLLLGLLNDAGFEKAIIYVKDLVENPRYQKKLSDEDHS